MDAFLDLFSLKRREGDRVYIDWLVDIKVPGEEAYIGFFGKDISTGGVRLAATSKQRVERVTAHGKHTHMRVKVPDERVVLEIDAELKWGPSGEDPLLTGWEFVHLRRDARRFIETYVRQHRADLVNQEGEEPSVN